MIVLLFGYTFLVWFVTPFRLVWHFTLKRFTPEQIIDFSFFVKNMLCALWPFYGRLNRPTDQASKAIVTRNCRIWSDEYFGHYGFSSVIIRSIMLTMRFNQISIKYFVNRESWIILIDMFKANLTTKLFSVKNTLSNQIVTML